MYLRKKAQAQEHKILSQAGQGDNRFKTMIKETQVEKGNMLDTIIINSFRYKKSDRRPSKDLINYIQSHQNKTRKKTDFQVKFRKNRWINFTKMHRLIIMSKATLIQFSKMIRIS